MREAATQGDALHRCVDMDGGCGVLGGVLDVPSYVPGRVPYAKGGVLGVPGESGVQKDSRDECEGRSKDEGGD